MKSHSWNGLVLSALVCLLPWGSTAQAEAAYPAPGTSSTSSAPSAQVNPIVLFPAFHFTKLGVSVRHQTAAPGCPTTGTFQDWFLNDTTDGFSQICKDKLLTLVYASHPSLPMARRFSNQPGVKIEIIDYGKTSSAPFYEGLYAYLENHGYRRDVNLRVAGYDARLTPDIGNFLERTVALIEQTYRDNGHRPVHLVGHSNGPVYAHYLLTHTSPAWKHKYIHGFTSIAGNLPGQGLLYTPLFAGFNVTDFSFPADPDSARISATMYQSAPSTYLSSSDPAILGNQEVIIRSIADDTSYTPRDYLKLFRDAGLPRAREIASYYIGFVKFADPAHYPNVDVYAEKGSGLPTLVGTELDDLSTGQVIDGSTAFYSMSGDTNQEDLTNDAILAWSHMQCFHFELTDNPGIDHFSLPSTGALLARLFTNANRPRSRCP